MHIEFSSLKLKKYIGKSEGNSLVISEMHMPEFFLNESSAHDNLCKYSICNNLHFGSLKKYFKKIFYAVRVTILSIALHCFYAYESWKSTVNFANKKWKCIVNFPLGNWKTTIEIVKEIL